ncbi:MAG: DUF3822 family protein [Muribaculaceae bacterium]|nr:DUF3822 family protein [Muribaculaceae bacterium]
MPDIKTEIRAIEQPRLWRLAMQIEGDAIRAALWSIVEDSSLRQFTLPLDPTLSPVKAIEEAVYSTPLLLSDFAKVDVILRTQAYTVVPKGLDEEARQKALRYLCLSDDSDQQQEFFHDIEECSAMVLSSADDELCGFLARTFRNPKIHSHISVLMRYFGRQSLLGNRAKLYTHLHKSGENMQVDIVATDSSGRLMLAVTYGVSTIDDILYYVLASARQSGFNLAQDEILLCGNSGMRDVLMPRLRRYATFVMPLIFPSAALRNGREALNAPFPIVILPLCE